MIGLHLLVTLLALPGLSSDEETYLYVGCFDNSNTDTTTRITGHLNYHTIENCADMSTGYFGMEWPQGTTSLYHAQCLLLSDVPSLNQVSDDECEREFDFFGRRLGSGNKLAVYTKEIESPMKKGEWYFENFVSGETGETGRLSRFQGVFQDGGHFTLENVAILEFEGETDTTFFGKIILFPDAPSMFRKEFDFMMECDGDDCETMIPFGQTIDACDISLIANAANGKASFTENLIGAGLRPFLSDSHFRSLATRFVYYVMQTKNFLNDKNRMGDDTDLGGGCEDLGNMASTFLRWVTSGESERIFNFRTIVNGLVELLDNSLGQLSFGVDINIKGRVLNQQQLATTSPFDVTVDNLHVVIDNGDQCTGNIVCAVLVALGEAFPGTTGHDKSVLGCTKFEFVFRLDREDWQNGNGIEYRCLEHHNFDSIKDNILDRVEDFWNSIIDAPGIKYFGDHNQLCFHDNHCKQDSDMCIAGLCDDTKRGRGETCFRDADCEKNDCLIFQCIEGENGSLCNTDDDCDSNRCNLAELACRPKLGWHETCIKDGDCQSGDCLLYKCIDGRDGDLCNTNDDCDSNRCNLVELTCRPKLGWHETCTQDADCQSGDCLFYKCIDGRDGDMCNTNDDCDSGRCSWFRCTPRGGKGDLCAIDNDCRSRDCSWWFTCN